MAKQPIVELEPDPVPVVKVLGTRFKRAMRSPEFSRRVKNFKGCFALAPPRDAQALTIDIKKDKVYLYRGVGSAASVIVHVDFDRFGEPGYSPSVEGIWRHPLMVYRISKLLDFPKASWADSAKRFWEHTRHLPRMPASIKVICEDDERMIALGDGPPEVEIQGASPALANLFDGSSILVREVTKKRIKIVGSLKDIAVLSGATQQLMLGEVDCEH